MVNGINQQNYSNPYGRQPTKLNKTDTNAPAFLLNYEEDGVIWEHADSGSKKATIKKDSVVEKKQPNKENKKDAVVLNSKTTEDTLEKATDDHGLLQGIKDFFHKVFQFIWYGDETKNDSETDSESEEKQKDTIDRNTADEAIQQSDEERIAEYLKKKDTEGVINVLTKNHTKQPARNTSLLTYYDRRGNIVNMGRTNTERILHGDLRKRTYRDSI
ncbi:MAG TPA: hypothetical protein PLZ77_07590 [Lachnospiraceae bacterium]|nr:hypothetical protein [Lachnospiraceae bacterium]HPF29951.1 hypothetical protein [Lachnospiraceae bacterium]